MQHFLTVNDATNDELSHLFEVAFALREERRAGKTHEPVLANKALAMLFEKPSLRTRVSFELATSELGGHAVVLGSHEIGLGKRESVADIARVLGRMCHGIAARVFDHKNLVELSQYAERPVVNMLSDDSHPCQALADAMTMMDALGRDLSGRTLVFVGDGNNCARSLARLAPMLGYTFKMSTPVGYELDHPKVEHITDPLEAVKDADAIYCDTFVSMGDESDKGKRLADFAKYQVNETLMAAAPDHAIVLHCLPAYRGIEITDAVLDGPQSHAFPQAENRLHAQKALLAVLMGGM